MVTDASRDFFVAAAGAAAALVGLLFVAISVAPDTVVGPTAPVRQQVLATTALLALLSPLVLSLIALIPGVDVGTAALVYGVLGLLFAAASVRRLLAASRTGTATTAGPAGRWWRSVRQVSGFAVVMALEVWGGLALIASPHAGIGYVAGAMVASLAIGVDRSWELIGARARSWSVSVRDLLGLEVPGDAPEGAGGGLRDGEGAPD